MKESKHNFIYTCCVNSHLIYGPSTTSPYKGEAFSPIAQAIMMVTDTGDWTYVRQAIGFTTLGVQAATGILNDAHLH